MFYEREHKNISSEKIPVGDSFRNKMSKKNTLTTQTNTHSALNNRN